MRFKFLHRHEREMHFARTVMHTMYFIFVSIESGHIYGYMAAILIILTACELVEGEHGPN